MHSRGDGFSTFSQFFRQIFDVVRVINLFDFIVFYACFVIQFTLSLQAERFTFWKTFDERKTEKFSKKKI